MGIEKKNKEEYNTYMANYMRAKYKRDSEWLNELKSEPCMDCNLSYHYCVMDFHHRNPMDKHQDVSRMLSRGCSREFILKEIEKCDLICSNCHRIREFDLKLAVVPGTG